MAWTSHAHGDSPQPLGGHTATLVADRSGRYVVVFGGTAHTPSRPGAEITVSEVSLLSDVFLLNVDTMRWTRPVVSGTVPTPRYGHDAVAYGEAVYLFGGYDVSKEANNDLHVLRPGANPGEWNWRLLSVMAEQMPGRRYGHTLNLLGSNMILFGGANEQHMCFNDVHRMDLSSEPPTWVRCETRGTPPVARLYHTATLVNDKYLFVFGGRNFSGKCLDDCNILNLETLEWSNHVFSGTPPRPRCQHTATFTGNRILIFGGYDSNAREWLGDLASLDTGSMVWSMRPPTVGLPTPRSRHTTTRIDERRLMVLGGFARDTFLSDLYILDLNPPENSSTVDNVQHEQLKRRYNQLLGMNLYELSVDELDEMQTTLLSSMRAVVDARRNKVHEKERLYQAEINGLMDKLSLSTSGIASPSSPGDDGERSQPATRQSTPISAPSASFTFAPFAPHPEGSRRSQFGSNHVSSPLSRGGSVATRDSFTSGSPSAAAAAAAAAAGNGEAATNDVSSTPNGSRKVRFGNVNTKMFSPSVYTNSVPTQGGSPLGLGQQVDETTEQINQYEKRRESEGRVPAWAYPQAGYIQEAERTRILLNAGHTMSELELKEQELANLRTEREESRLSPTYRRQSAW